MMFTQYEEKGKIFTNVVTKSHVTVKIQTTTNLVRGTVHVRPDERLKDELNQSEMFIAVTDASIYNLKGKLVYRARFLALNVTQIIWLYQEDDQERTGDES
jgi:hypothetical protein